jgi:hypothetical protein
MAELLTLKIEATRASETSVEFQRTKQRYFPEDVIEFFIITATETSNPAVLLHNYIV